MPRLQQGVERKFHQLKFVGQVAAIKMERVTTLKIINNSPILAYSHAFLYSLNRNENK